MTTNSHSVSVSALKASLRRYLRQVKAGEEVIVTERDRPVAKLVPVTGAASATAHLREMERDGRIRLGSGRLPADFWRLSRAKDPKGLLRRAVDEERSSLR